MFQVYCVTTNDGRVYVGCTASLKRRMREHRHLRRPFVLLPHTVRVLMRSRDKAAAERGEARYIARLGAADPARGWNLRLGGNGYPHGPSSRGGFGRSVPAARHGEANGMHGRRHSQETIEKIRARAVGRSSAMKGRHYSDEQRRAIRAKRGDKGFLRGPDHPMFGRTHSAETRAKIAASRRGH